MIVAIDSLVFVSAWAIAQIVFQGYEAHVGIQKRLIKLAILLGVLTVVHLAVGRIGFYGLIGVLTVGVAVLHGFWFHYHHGIHWRTAEPKDKYLALIGVSEQKR